MDNPVQKKIDGSARNSGKDGDVEHYREAVGRLNEATRPTVGIRLAVPAAFALSSSKR